MNLWKRAVALLAAVMLMLCVVPGVFATETDTAETTAPSTEPPSWRTDYSELELQIAIANGLNEYEYSAESWKVMRKAVDSGNTVLKQRYGQKSVDAAAEAIEEAISDLVKMDYSKLEAALGEVSDLVAENPDMHDVWGRLNVAAAQAKPLLVSGDQAAVDEAAAKISALLEERASYEVTREQPVEVVIQEVEVEVLPTDDYCNIPMHRTWPVLFVISAVLNVALIVVLIYVIMKKRNTDDNTPLVSYDIDDDMDF